MLLAINILIIKVHARRMSPGEEHPTKSVCPHAARTYIISILSPHTIPLVFLLCFEKGESGSVYIGQEVLRR